MTEPVVWEHEHTDAECCGPHDWHVHPHRFCTLPYQQQIEENEEAQNV